MEFILISYVPSYKFLLIGYLNPYFHPKLDLIMAREQALRNDNNKIA